MATIYPARTTGKTPAGKAVSARNATTHGLFCRQTVLPHLGEDPAGYQRLLDTLHEQLRPRNLMERQYLELWADASWKMRRLSRCEAQVWEDDRLDEDARLHKLERLARLQTGLRRQLDKAVRMLSQDVPNLFAHRTREDVLAKMNLTESHCAESPFRAREIEQAVQANTRWPDPADDFDPACLDNQAATPDEAPENDNRENCQNELRPSENSQNEICQNELAPTPAQADPDEDATVSPRAQRRRELQRLEDQLNSGTLTPQERRQILMGPDIPGFTLTDGRVEIHTS